MSEGVKRFENGLAEGKYPEGKIVFIKDYILQKKILDINSKKLPLGQICRAGAA